LVSADGGVFAFGNHRFAGGLAGRQLAAPIVGALANPDAKFDPDGTVRPSGYLLVDAAGHVYPFGETRSLGDLTGRHLRAPIVAAAGNSRDYILVGADGGVFTFGHVFFQGSLAGRHLPAPIVGAVLDDIGSYSLADRQGRVYSFCCGGVVKPTAPLSFAVTAGSPVVDIAGGNVDGYWLATSDGHVVGVGTDLLRPLGDMHRAHLAAPIVRIIHSENQFRPGCCTPQLGPSGYYLLAADGGVFAFNAQFLGSLSGHRLAQPVTGMYFGLVPNRDG
jgi:hypothetical protein